MLLRRWLYFWIMKSFQKCVCVCVSLREDWERKNSKYLRFLIVSFKVSDTPPHTHTHTHTLTHSQRQ